MPRFMMAVLSVEVILGSLTFTGSLMAAGKLQEVLPERPLTYKGQNFVNLSLLAIAAAVSVYLALHPGRSIFNRSQRLRIGQRIIQPTTDTTGRWTYGMVQEKKVSRCACAQAYNSITARTDSPATK